MKSNVESKTALAQPLQDAAKSGRASGPPMRSAQDAAVQNSPLVLRQKALIVGLGAAPAQREEKPNRTGLPDNLKAGVENLSGVSLDPVKVHYGSDKPAKLSALAYTQGTDIHVAPGQERHLPHEAWHVVQQAQGRVRPTLDMAGTPVNDDAGLEGEADAMGAKALQEKSGPAAAQAPRSRPGSPAAQLARSPNPRPAVETGQGLSDGSGTVAEHHLIPHKLLLKFWEKAEEKNGGPGALIEATGSVMGEWSRVKVKELKDSGVIKEEWFDDDFVKTILTGGYAGVKDTLVDAALPTDVTKTLMAKNASDLSKKLGQSVKAARANWAHIAAGGHDPGKSREAPDTGELVNLATPYYEWMPGNLVVGPEGGVRAKDPKDKFDAEAAGALESDHLELIKSLYAQMDSAVKTGEAGAVQEALRGIICLGREFPGKTVPRIYDPVPESPAAPYWSKNGSDLWELH